MVENILILVTVLLVVCNLYLLGSSSLQSTIRGVALQGFILGAFPILTLNAPITIHAVLLALSSIVVKGICIPLFLRRAIRGVNINRERDPLVGYSRSVLFGIIATGLAFYVLRKIPVSSVIVSPLHAGIAISTACTGIFLIITRRKAITQIIGYLIFENSAYLMGISLAADQPIFVEMAILLDMLVGVFIMGIIIYKINAEFDSISTKELETLKQ